MPLWLPLGLLWCVPGFVVSIGFSFLGTDLYVMWRTYPIPNRPIFVAGGGRGEAVNVSQWINVHPPCLSIGRLECDLFSIRRSTDRPRVYLYSAPIDRTSSRLSVDDQRYTVMPLDRHDVVRRDYETFRITPLLRDRTILIADERGWWLGLPRVLDSKKNTRVMFQYSSTRLIPLPVGYFNFRFQFSKSMSNC